MELNIFKSSKERERDRQRAVYRATMEVNRAKQNLAGQIDAQRKARDAAWVRARNYLRDGQKLSAQRELNAVRTAEARIANLEKRLFVYSDKASALEIATTDQEFSKALGELNTAVNIDAGKVIDTISDVGASLTEQDTITGVIDGEYAQQMNGLNMTDAIPSMEEMMANLEQEVVAEVSGGQPVGKKTSTANKAKSGSLSEAIGEGRRKLKDLMEKK